MAKRILYITPTSGIGGAETFLLQTARFHSKGDYEPIYACFRNGPLVEKLRQADREVLLAPRPPRLSRPWQVFATIYWLKKIILAKEIDLVHSTLAYGAIFGAPAALIATTPHLWFQHGPVSGWQDWLAGKMPGLGVFVNSQHTLLMQRSFHTRKTLDPHRLGVMFDPSELNSHPLEIRHRFELQMDGEGKFLTAMVCRPQPQKGIELWLEATALLRREGIPAGCLLVGGNPAGSTYENTLLDLARLLNVPLIWKSATPTPWNEAGVADALVCASTSPEGYGLTVAEAQSRGICAIAPREGGPLDLIQDGKTGLLFEPRNALSLKEALKKIYEEESLRSQLGKNGKLFAEKELSAESSISRLEEKYQNYLASTLRA